MNRVLFKSLLGILLTSSSALAGPLPFDKSEYAARRTRFMAQISDGIAVIRGSLAGPQDNDFRYLCGVEVPRAILIVDGIRKESLLFYTTTENYLKGEGLSPDLAHNPQTATGVENCYDADRFSSLLGQLLEQSGVIYTPFKSDTQTWYGVCLRCLRHFSWRKPRREGGKYRSHHRKGMRNS